MPRKVNIGKNDPSEGTLLHMEHSSWRSKKVNINCCEPI